MAGGEVSGVKAISIGQSSTAAGLNGIAVGAGSTASAEDSTSIGYNSTASGVESIAIGATAIASSVQSVAIGHTSTATTGSAVAIGPGTDARAAGATALGLTAQATQIGATALGAQASASGINSTAIGTNATATSALSIVLGTSADTVTVTGDLEVDGDAVFGDSMKLPEYTTNPTFIASSHEGTQIYNTTDNKFYGGDDTEWVDLTGGGGGASGVPNAPTNGVTSVDYALRVPITGSATWEEVASGGTYILPAATNTTLGGVIVPASSDINIDSDGDLTLGRTITLASTETFEVAKAGTPVLEITSTSSTDDFGELRFNYNSSNDRGSIAMDRNGGSYRMLFDIGETSNALIVTDAGGLRLGAGTTLTNTHITKLAALTATAAEINLLDGRTASDFITSAQIAAITANTAKTGITAAQANAITANTSKTGISDTQASAITANTAKTGITPAQTSAITANTAKTGITSNQAAAIVLNTAKTGITTAQASAITANTAKNSVTGTNDGTDWTGITIGDDTFSIPVFGSSFTSDVNVTKENPLLDLFDSKAAAGSNGTSGKIGFYARTNDDSFVQYGNIETLVENSSDDAYRSRMQFQVAKAGALSTILNIDNDTVEIFENASLKKSNPVFSIENTSTAVDDYEVGRIDFVGLDDASTPNEVTYGQIYFEADDVSEGSEDSIFIVTHKDQGADQTVIKIGSIETSVGENAGTAGNGSTAIGADSSAAGANSIAIGRSTTTDFPATGSVSIGMSASVTGSLSIGIGRNVSVTSNSSVAIGNGAQVATSNTIVLGTSTETTEIPGDFQVSGTTINFANLPTADTGLATGDLWNDGGTLKIA